MLKHKLRYCPDFFWRQKSAWVAHCIAIYRISSDMNTPWSHFHASTSSFSRLSMHSVFSQACSHSFWESPIKPLSIGISALSNQKHHYWFELDKSLTTTNCASFFNAKQLSYTLSITLATSSAKSPLAADSSPSPTCTLRNPPTHILLPTCFESLETSKSHKSGQLFV